MIWLDIILYVLAVISIAFSLFPFSPMTLKLYMPSRDMMILTHRYRRWLWGAGLILFIVLAWRALTGVALPGWGWAIFGALIFFLLFAWGGYVPVIMHPSTIRKQLAVQEAGSILRPQDDVLGLEIDGEARAYSRTELTRPHVVMDEIAGHPVAVTYCILCNSAQAFKAELKGKHLNFHPVTAFNNNIIYYDSANGNYIQQLDGRVIAGPDSGAQLNAFPVTMTTWQSWKDMHPDTQFIHLPATGFRDKMLSWMLDWMIPLSGLAQRHGPWHPIYGQIDQRLAPMAAVIGVEIAGQQRVYPLEILRKDKVINDTVGDHPIVVLYDSRRDAAAVFSRQVNGQTLCFRPENEGNTDWVTVDEETGGHWDISGIERNDAAEGEGRRLKPVPHFGKLFWFSWALFKPQTDIKEAV